MALVKDALTSHKLYESSNKNRFEEHIDIDMINLVCEGDQELYDKIMNAPLSKKRIAILSLLDNDRTIFKGIQRIVESNNVSKVQHIKDVVSMLRDYVKVGDVEKKKFGEVMTPISLVNEMLDTLPIEVWSNPELKWLDPANGCGVFPSVVVKRLMEGLSEWESDEEKRYKHIMENMLYVCELQMKNMFLHMCAFDPKDEYDMNVYCGSFLDEDFDVHMKNVWGVDKFDIVVGNPPYNDARSNDENSNTKDLYDKFITKSYYMTDKLMMVIPSRWFIKNALRKFRYDMFNTFNLKYIIHYDNNKYFPNADIKGGICYFLSDKTYIGLTNVNQTNLDLTKFEILPTIIDENVFNLTKKLDSYKNIQDLFRSKNSFGIKTNDKRLSNTGAVKCSTSLSNGLFKFIPTDVVKSHDELAKYKIAIPCAYGKGGSEEKTFYTRIVELKPNEVCNESFVYFSFSNQTEANSFKSYIQTTFVKFLVKLRKIKQDITTDVFKWVPIVPLDREWTDEQLFDYFNLTQEERQLILENKI